LLALQIVFAIGLAGILWQWRRAERNSILANSKLVDSYIAQARATRRSDRIGRRYDSLTAISNAVALNPTSAQREQLRNEAIACYALTDLRVIKQWPAPSNPQESREPIWCFDSQLQLYARAVKPGEISVCQVANDRELARLRSAGTVKWIRFFSRDGRFLATYEDDTYRLWEIASAQVVLTSDHDSWSWSFSPDTRSLGISRPDGSLSIYALDTFVEIKRIQLRSKLGFVQFLEDGARIAGIPVEWDRVEIDDLQTGKVLETFFPPSREVYYQTVSADGHWIAAVTRPQGRICLWNTSTGDRLDIDAHQKTVNALRFNRAGTLLASLSQDGDFRLTDCATGHSILRGSGGGSQIRFASDDRHLEFADALGFSLYEVAPHPAFRLVGTSHRQLPDSSSICFSPDGQILATGPWPIRFWETATGEARGAVPDEPGSVHFGSDGRSLISWGAEGLVSRSIQKDDGATNVIRLGPPINLIRFGPTSRLMAWDPGGVFSDVTPGGRFAVTPQRDRAAVFDLENPSAVISLGPHSNTLSTAISPNGRFVATSDFEGSGVKVWDVASRGLLKDLPTSEYGSTVFSPDGRWLATDGENDHVYRLYRTESWDLQLKVTVPHETAGHVNNFAFSPDGEMWAIGNSPRSIHLYSTATGRPLAVLEAPEEAQFTRLTFSPDGTTLAVLQRDGIVQLWDLREVRGQLAALGLDWEAPGYVPAIVQRQSKPIRIEIAESTASVERRAFLAQKIPARSDKADARLIDLSAFYNAALTETWHEDTPGNDLSELKPGLVELAGVLFDVRGLIQAWDSSPAGLPYTEAAKGIPVNRICLRLHFLHSAIFAGDTPPGTLIGTYTVHYADRRPEMEIPILMGKDVLDWRSQPKENLADVTVAWTGQNDQSRKTGQTIRLFQTTWNNPSPSVPVTQVDFSGRNVRAKPFLVAITAE
jgi:WD40 repeat protein